MKKTAYIIFALSALVAGLWACGSKTESVVPEALPADVELRYRANDVYNLAASNPEVISIVVKSTKPWTVRSYHPDWCMISQESGEAVPDSLVHVGKGENTTVKIQYYDNTMLDDRTDYIEIASDGFVGKKFTVIQKGSAYIGIPEEETAIMLSKNASEASFHVLSNQPWSTAITSIDGEWLTIANGLTGEKDGVVTVSAKKNTAEMRYATVTLYDRNKQVVADVMITQDGVQLEPADTEIRAEWNASEGVMSVAANTHWTVTKSDATVSWFDVVTKEFDGDGVIKLTFQENNTGTLRESSIIIQTDPDENGFSVKHAILVRQAYPVSPVKYMFDANELSLWTADKGVDPVYTEGVGTLFTSVSSDKYARLNRSMAAGSYSFFWKEFKGEEIDVRLWFCYSSGQEIKLYFSGSALELSFNQGSDPASQEKPSKTYGVTEGFDPAVGHAISMDFQPSGEYSHIIVSVDGVMAYEFDTSATAISNCKWGSDINMYIGVDAGSAVLEWYEYTPLFSWD